MSEKQNPLAVNEQNARMVTPTGLGTGGTNTHTRDNDPFTAKLPLNVFIQLIRFLHDVVYDDIVATNPDNVKITAESIFSGIAKFSHEEAKRFFDEGGVK